MESPHIDDRDGLRQLAHAAPVGISAARAARRLTAAAVLTALAAGVAPVPAGAVEVAVDGWPRMGLAFSDENVVYSKSTVTVIAGRGRSFPVYRTDTFRLPLAGDALTGRRIPAIVMRTSAGTTTGGMVAGGGDGRHVLMATGTGFSPQVVYCCLPEVDRAFPVEARGEPAAPRTVVVDLDGGEARYVTLAPDGQATLRTRNVDATGPLYTRRLATPLGAAVNNRTIALRGSQLAWVDQNQPTLIASGTVDPGTLAITPGPSFPSNGTVARLLVEPGLVVAVVAGTDGRYRIVRYDAPTWTPTEVWSDLTPPGAVALGGRAIAYRAGAQVFLQAAGAASVPLTRPNGSLVALATDGTRVAVLERRTRIRRGLRQKRSIIRIATLTQTP